MEYTQEQLSSFKQELARKRQRQFWVGGVIVLTFLLLVLLQRSRDGSGAWLLGVWATGVVAAVFFSLQNWRCPACHRYLGRVRNPNFCPRCGIALR